MTAHTAQHTAETSAYYHTARAASAAVVAAPPLHHITAVAADVGGLLHHLIPRPGDDLGTDTLQRPLVTARTTSGEHEGDNDNKKRHAEEKEEHANRPAVVLGEFRRRPAVEHAGDGGDSLRHPAVPVALPEGRQHIIIDYPLQQGIRQVAFETVSGLYLYRSLVDDEQNTEPVIRLLAPHSPARNELLQKVEGYFIPDGVHSHDNDLGPAALLQRIEHGVDAVNRRLRQQPVGVADEAGSVGRLHIGNILHAIGSRTTEEGIRSTKGEQ